MALIADEYMGQITLPQVTLRVSGSPCLADTLQGLSRARLANPARFEFTAQDGPKPEHLGKTRPSPYHNSQAIGKPGEL